MSKQTIYLILSGIMVIMFVIAPYVLRFRILVLRKLRLNWFADLHENHFKGFVIAARLILLAIAIVLLVLGL